MTVTRSGNGDGGAAGGSVVFAPVQHPVLRSVDPRKVSIFLRQWERYTDEVAEKKKEVPSMSMASFKVAVDRGLLRSMHTLGRLDEVAPGLSFAELTSEGIEAYVRSLVKKTDMSQVNPTVIQEALKGVRVDMSAADPEARILEYVHDIFESLDGAGYGSFKDDNPEKTVKLIQEKLYPSNLKAAMAENLEYQEGLKNKVKEYVCLLCKEAIVQDKVRPIKANTTKAGASSTGNFREGSRERGKTINQKESRKNRSCNNNTADGSGPSKNLLSLNGECKEKGIRHPGGVRHCPETPRDKAEELIKSFLKKKREKSSKKVQDEKTTEEENSTLMGATFEGMVSKTICADGGSDINLLPPDVYASLLERRADMRVHEFSASHKYGLAASGSYVHCIRDVIMDVELHIRHGKSLTIRNLKWLVAIEGVDEPLLGRPIQEALGLNTKEILEAACDRHRGCVNADEMLKNDDYPGGSIARILSSGMFHSDRASQDGEISPLLEQRDELGVDTEEELSAALDGMVERAEKKGMTGAGLIKLKGMLHDYRDVFKVRLGPGPPANVEPMTVNIKADSVPFIARGRRYPADQRDYISRFADTLVEFGMAKPNIHAEWASAPLIVPKSTPGNYRLTFDLRRVNQATRPMTWPMPHVHSELRDFACSRRFSSIDFCSGYWQMPLDEDSQPYHSFFTPDGVYQPTRTLQGAMNSVQNFQSRVEPCFRSIKDNLKAWLDDFAVHAKTDSELVEKLTEFCRICRQRNLKVSAKKTELFDTKLHWCGYIVDEDGVKCDPHRLSGIKEGSPPVNAAELSQFVNCLQWMANFIPNFAYRVKPLREVLEKAYEKSGKRTSRSVQGIKLSQLSWGPEHLEAFQGLQEQLREAVKLAHRDVEKTLCVYTDASDEHWAAVITQCDPACLKLPFECTNLWRFWELRLTTRSNTGALSSAKLMLCSNHSRKWIICSLVRAIFIYLPTTATCYLYTTHLQSSRLLAGTL